jgi:hypothetical protein
MEKTTQLSQLTDKQLVEEFNGSVSVIAHLILEDAFIETLKIEFERREIDCGKLGGINKYSFRHCVVLFRESLFRVRDLPSAMVNLLLLFYLAEKHPDMMDTIPRVRSYGNDEIVFEFIRDRMKPGEYRVNSNDVVKCIMSKK